MGDSPSGGLSPRESFQNWSPKLLPEPGEGSRLTFRFSVRGRLSIYATEDSLLKLSAVIGTDGYARNNAAHTERLLQLQWAGEFDIQFRCGSARQNHRIGGNAL